MAAEGSLPGKARATGRPERTADRPDLDYAGLFDASPNPYLVLDRRLHIAGANQAYLRATKRRLEDIVGRWAWDAFPTDPETLRQSVASFERVIREGRPDTMALLRFDIPRPEAEGGGFEERYWSIVHAPVPGGAGEVALVLQHPIDVTELKRLRDAVESEEEGRRLRLEAAQSGIFGRARAVHEANRSLKAEGERLRLLFEQAPGFMCVLRGPEHRFELANAAYTRLIGRHDLVGKPVREALPEIEGQGFFERLDHVYATGEPFSGRGLEVILQADPGAAPETRVLDFVYQPIADDAGRVSGIFVQGSDVTAAKRTGDDLRAERDRTRAIFESAVDFAIVATDREGRVTDWNTGAERILGWSAGEMVGKAVDCFFTPEDRAERRPVFEMRRALEAGRATDERWHLRKDGSRFWASGEMMPLRGEGGTHLGFLKILRDRTEQRRTEEALVASYARTNEILESISDAFYAVDREWRFTYVNRKAEEWWGRKREDLVGKIYWEEFPQAVGSEVYEAHLRAARERRMVHIETTSPILHHWVEVSIYPSDGGVSVYFRDISERKRGEAALRASEARLDRALSIAKLGLFEWELETDQVIASRRTREIFGFEADAGAKVEDYFAAIHPEDLPRVHAAVEASLSGPGRLEIEYRIRRPDGGVRYVSTLSELTRDAAGRPFCQAGVFEDVTARRSAEVRQAFLLTLADRLRSLPDPRAVMTAAVEALGRHLGASRVGYGQVQADDRTIVLETGYADGVAPLAGVHPLEGFGRANIARQREGRTIVRDDITADPDLDQATWAALEVRAFVSVPLVRDGRFRASLFVNSRTARIWPPEEVALIEEVAARIWDAVERARAEEALRQSEARWRGVFENMHEGFALCEVVYGPGGEAVDYRYLEVNAAVERLSGIPRAAIAGRLASEAIPGIERFWTDIYTRVVETGEPVHFEHQIAAIGRWFEVFAYRTEPGRFATLFLNITERKAAAERQALLAREVDHRAKNALAVVQAALRLTQAADVPGYVRAIEGRVAALARAQTLLADDRWAGADLRMLLRGELATFLDVSDRGGPWVELAGPPVALPAGAAQPLAMAVHELATNALKYGALSVPAGHVAVSWLLEGGPWGKLQLRWTEAGGPPVAGPPARRGFGSRVLDSTVRGQLGGKLSLAWAVSGLVCEMEVPLKRGPAPTSGAAAG